MEEPSLLPRPHQPSFLDSSDFIITLRRKHLENARRIRDFLPVIHTNITETRTYLADLHAYLASYDAMISFRKRHGHCTKQLERKLGSGRVKSIRILQGLELIEAFDLVLKAVLKEKEYDAAFAAGPWC